MGKHKKNRAVNIFLVLGMAAALMTGCNENNEESAEVIEPMEAEEVYATSFDIIGGNDVMPIAAYYGPYASNYNVDGQSLPDYITEEYWADMAACGINVMCHSITDYSSAPLEVEKNLDFGEKYKIAVVVDDSKVVKMAGQENISMEELTTQLSKYMNHPAFGGIYLIDEPVTSYYMPSDSVTRNLERYKTLAPLLNQEIGIFTYSNALSSAISEKWITWFEQYLREYCDTLTPRFLSYDRYPFDKIQEGYMDRYFYDLSIVRRVADDYGIPFWTFIQAGSQWNDSQNYFDTEGYYPDEGEFDWNINTCLAFGSKGISYFPYIQPYYFAYAKSTDFDFERNGMIGAWGNKNRWYYYAQNISKHIQAIDEVLMNSVSKGVIASGEQAVKDTSMAEDVMLEGTSWRELAAVEGDAVIGCFNYQGHTALYVVNYSQEYAQKVNLIFKNTVNITMIQNAESSRLKGRDMILDLAAGEGVLLVLE